mmetsp:Transcript_25896/g.33493  ORF Transcript_25896/g.33493 Transcript_25896/m.33493 type:complete len:423 (-) Transcript_25896:49-1317(-)
MWAIPSPKTLFLPSGFRNYWKCFGVYIFFVLCKQSSTPTALEQKGKSGILIPQKNFVVAALNIQKTGSTLFNTAFCDALRSSTDSLRRQGKTLADVSGGFAGLWSWECPLGGSTQGHGDRARPDCTHHGDLHHLIQCLADQFGNAVFMTILRDPVQRLISEFRHVKGDVMNEYKGSWKCFQPMVCKKNETAVYHKLGAEEVEMYIEKRNKVYNTTTSSASDQLQGEMLQLFHEWVALGHANPANNRMTRHLAGPLGCAESVKKSRLFDQTWMIQSAKQNIQDKVIFGLQHDYHRSLVLMNAQLLKLFGQDRRHGFLRKKFLINPYSAQRQVNTNRDASKEYKVDRKTIKIISEHNRMDFALFQWAKKIFEERYEFLKGSEEFEQAEKKLSLNVKKAPENYLKKLKENRQQKSKRQNYKGKIR